MNQKLLPKSDPIKNKNKKDVKKQLTEGGKNKESETVE